MAEQVICPECGAWVSNLHRHKMRKRCSHHEGAMEKRRLELYGK